MIERFKNRMGGFEAAMIMRICLGLSLVLHISFVLAFPKAFPWAWHEAEEPSTYQVEFLRPPVEDLEQDDLADGEMGKAGEKNTPVPEDSQDTISLDTQDKRYVSYARIIKESIMGQWEYPPEARENLIEGKLLVVFSLSRNGHLTAVRTLRSSGHAILDDEALRAIRAAAPFPSFPDNIRVARLNVQASIDYQITARR
ncbi:MAG: energy transducer TonB [Desulfatiglandales bacterium]